MCRDNDHGGRRCPHDTAKARRLRRHKAQVIAAHPNVSYGHVAGFVRPGPAQVAAAMKPKPAAPVTQTPATLEAVQQARSQVQTLEQDYQRITADPFSISYESPYMLDGQPYADSIVALRAIDAKLEDTIINAGDMVAEMALRDQPYAETAVTEYTRIKLTEFGDELDALERHDHDADELTQMAALRGDIEQLETELNLHEATRSTVDDMGAYALQHFRLQVALAEKKKTLRNLRYSDGERAAALDIEIESLLNPAEPFPRQVEDILQTHANAYLRVLHQVRPYGGGKQQVHEDSDQAAVEILNQALKYYPNDWVDADPGLDTLIVRAKEGRVFYAHHETIITKIDKMVTPGTFSELSISKDQECLGPLGFDTAIHEYAHRVEWLGPRLIARMENHFLVRRTTHKGVRETQQKPFPGLDEYAYFDKFANAYMGRVYPKRVNREILSMGMESIFAGTQGAFMGVAGSRPDPEMKRFILGLLATA